MINITFFLDHTEISPSATNGFTSMWPKVNRIFEIWTDGGVYIMNHSDYPVLYML